LRRARSKSSARRKPKPRPGATSADHAPPVAPWSTFFPPNRARYGRRDGEFSEVSAASEAARRMTLFTPAHEPDGKFSQRALPVMARMLFLKKDYQDTLNIGCTRGCRHGRDSHFLEASSLRRPHLASTMTDRFEGAVDQLMMQVIGEPDSFDEDPVFNGSAGTASMFAAERSCSR